MNKPCCPNPHNPGEVRPYAHLPKVVLPRCRFEDAEYMAEVRRRHPHTEFLPDSTPLMFRE